MREDASPNVLFETGYSLWFVGKFSNKEKWFTNLVGDEMPRLRPYCFGRSCLSLEMLQKFVVLDIVLIFSLIQIF